MEWHRCRLVLLLLCFSWKTFFSFLFSFSFSVFSLYPIFGHEHEHCIGRGSKLCLRNDRRMYRDKILNKRGNVSIPFKTPHKIMFILNVNWLTCNMLFVFPDYISLYACFMWNSKRGQSYPISMDNVEKYLQKNTVICN